MPTDLPLTDERLNTLLALASDGPWSFRANIERGGWHGIEGPGGDVLVLALALGDGGDADVAWIPDDGISSADRELIERARELAVEVKQLRARVADGDRLRALALAAGERLTQEVERLRALVRQAAREAYRHGMVDYHACETNDDRADAIADRLCGEVSDVP